MLHVQLNLLVMERITWPLKTVVLRCRSDDKGYRLPGKERLVIKFHYRKLSMSNFVIFPLHGFGLTQLQLLITGALFSTANNIPQCSWSS